MLDWSIGLQRLTNRRQRESVCIALGDDTETCEGAKETIEARCVRARLRRELVGRARTIPQMIGQSQLGRAVDGCSYPAAGAHLNQLRVRGND